jgi:hypothetical protein
LAIDQVKTYLNMKEKLDILLNDDWNWLCL